MSNAALLVVVGSVLAASIIQTISGFGFALLSVPLMTLAIDTKTAVVVSTLAGVLVTVTQAWRLRAHIERTLVKRLTIAAYAGMPLGLVIFTAVSETTLQRMLGVAVVLAVILLAAGLDLTESGRALEAGAGFVSGVLATSLSTNGPPVVFALQARRLAPDPFRATILTVFACCNVGALSAFLLAGKVTRAGVVASVLSIPAMIIGQALGRPLRRRVQGPRFRWLVLAMMTAVAGRVIVASF